MLSEALSLYHGPFAEEIFGNWAGETRANLETKAIDAGIGAAEVQIQLGDKESAIAVLNRVLGLDGSSFRRGRVFALQGEDMETVTLSLMLALAGLFFGLSRARRHGSVRLAIGVALCGFAAVIAGLQFV